MSTIEDGRAMRQERGRAPAQLVEVSRWLSHYLKILFLGTLHQLNTLQLKTFFVTSHF